MECCGSCGDGCNGGWLEPSWSYWKSHGLVTGGLYDDKKTCKPYAFPPCQHHSKGPRDDCSKHDYDSPVCKSECSNADYDKSYKDDKIYGKKAYSVRGEGLMM